MYKRWSKQCRAAETSVEYDEEARNFRITVGLVSRGTFRETNMEPAELVAQIYHNFVECSTFWNQHGSTF